MVRFARIKGVHSKSSFNKVPEEASTWEELRACAATAEEPEPKTNEDPREWESPRKKEIPKKVEGVWCEFETETVATKEKKKKKRRETESETEHAEGETRTSGVPASKKRKGKNEFVATKRVKKLDELKRKLKEEGKDEKDIFGLAATETEKHRRELENLRQGTPEECEGLSFFKGGQEIKLVKFDGRFLVTEERAKKLGELRERLKEEGKDEKRIRVIMENERRKAQRELKHMKKKTRKEKELELVENKRNNPESEEPEGTENRKKKPESEELLFCKDGEEIKLEKFDGYLVAAERARKLREMRDQLRREGKDEKDIFGLVKAERRRAERELKSMKKSLCFHCRKGGHVLSDCPELEKRPEQGSGICFKCGSTEHMLSQCKSKSKTLEFATCFICHEKGHLSRNCTNNPRGLYPDGGGCKNCGDVTHYERDCPKRRNTQEEWTVKKIDSNDVEALDYDDEIVKSKKPSKPDVAKRHNKIIKFV